MILPVLLCILSATAVQIPLSLQQKFGSDPWQASSSTLVSFHPRGSVNAQQVTVPVILSHVGSSSKQQCYDDYEEFCADFEQDGFGTCTSDGASFFAGSDSPCFHAVNLNIGKRLSEVETFADSRGIQFMEENDVLQASDVQSPTTWGLDKISDWQGASGSADWSNSYEFHHSPTDGQGVKVYVLDTGFDFAWRDNTQEFLGGVEDGAFFSSGSMSCGNNWQDEYFDARDEHGHGTHVSGTIAAKDYGVAKKATIIPVRVLGKYGCGAKWDTIKGIEFVADDCDANEKCVINMSLGGGASDAQDDALRAGKQAGLVMVAASGNDFFDACAFSPARSPDVITVGSHGKRHARTGFSNWGSCTNIHAPGEDVVSTTLHPDVATFSGTSMATPHVAGLVATMMSIHGKMSQEEVMALFNADWGVKNILTDARGSANLVAIRIPLGGATPTPSPPGQFRFEAVTSNECPANADLSECTADMSCNTLCEADRTLPDGQSNFDVNNCGGYDVWRKICSAGFSFSPVTNCPSSPTNLPECTLGMACGSLCEADQPLPDGQVNYDINNCGSYDVFEKVCGGQAQPTPSPTTVTSPPVQGATYVPAPTCPSNPDLPECTEQTTCGGLCEADQPLPDGNMNYNIDNCAGGYDVFQKICGGQVTSQPTSRPTASPPSPPVQGATYVPAPTCPSNPDLPECTDQTACGGLCEADRPLPDGNTNYNINNCAGGYDVFQKICGGQGATAEPTASSQGATFVAVTTCPSNPDLAECTAQTACGGLCEADRPLPDGNTNFDINNCGGYDVFQKTCGGQGATAEPTAATPQGATYVPAPTCPSNPDLPECTDRTACGSLCEADRPLPDGNTNYNINNCAGGYDVFQKICGGQGATAEPTPTPQGGNGRNCPKTGNYLEWCQPCMFNAQCPQNGFCCPYMKKCVSSSSHGCYSPIANCRPPYHESSQGYPDSRQCDNSDFPNNWMDYDDCMRKSGKAPRLLRL